MEKSKQLFLIVFMLQVNWVCAQSAENIDLPTAYYHVKNWRVENPIGKTVIGDVLVNSKGILLVATNQGIKSFDGNRFNDAYRYNTKINNFTLSSIKGDRVVWGFNQLGLFKFNENSFKQIEHSTYSNIYNKFTLDIRGIPWIVLNNTLMSYQDSKYIKYSLPYSVSVVTSSKRHNILVGLKGAIAYVDKFGYVTNTIKFPDKNTLVFSIYETHAGVVWISTNKGTFTYDGELNHHTQFNQLPLIGSFYEDTRHNIWIATINGIYVYQNNRLKQVNVDNNANLRIRGITEDKFGNIWFGTWGKGLFRLKSTPFDVYETKDNPTAYLQTENGWNWIGGYLGLSAHKLGEHKNIVIPDMQKIIVADIEEGINGDIWVALKNNLIKIDSQGKVFDFKNFKDNLFRFIVKNNGKLWVGTDTDLYVKNLSDDSSFEKFPFPEDDYILLVFKLENSKLLFFTYKHAYIFDHGKLVQNALTKNLKLKNLVVNYDSKTSSVWYYDPDSNEIIQHNDKYDKKYKLDEILRNLTFYSLEFTDNHNLILYGESGIIRIREEWLMNYDHSQSLYFEILPIPGTEDAECNSGYRAVSMDKDKNLKFTCKSVLLTLHEDRLTSQHSKNLDAEIRSVIVQGRKYEDHAVNLQVSPDTQSFQFTFGSNNLNQLSPPEFRYKLHGIDDEWTNTFNLKSAIYAELKPGVYQFEVQVRNSHTTWSETSKGQFQFTVLKYFYQTVWFISLMVLLLILTVLFYGWFKTLRHKKETKRLLKMVQYRTKELVEVQVRELNLQQKSTENLALEVEKRTQELQQQMLLTLEKEQQLREAQKMEVVGQLTSGIAHDFNNMLSVIFIGSELIKKDLEANQSNQKENLKWLNNVLLTAENCKAVINQLIQFTHKERNNKSIIGVSEALKSITHLLKVGMPETINFEINIPNEENLIEVDISQFNQIILNLIINARNACEDYGKVMISSKKVLLNKSDICSSCHQLVKGEFVEITVEDTGRGIAKEIIPHIFTPFFRTTNKQEGTGIGLHIVHSNLHKMKGHVFVQSKIGIGSVFKILIPLTEKKKQKAISVNSKQENIKKDRSVLLVEDSESLVELLSWIFEEEGIVFDVAYNGLEGMELFFRNPNKYDLILTDNSMPKMTGLDMSKEILKSHPKTRIVLLTGNITDEIAEASENLGIKEIFLKPVKSEELIDIINSYLNHTECKSD